MKKTLMTLAALAILLPAGAASANDVIVGTWASTDGESKIEITPCGDKFCNTIIWLKEPRKDSLNEDKSLRERDLVGLRISDNLKHAGGNKWSGDVYAPKKGKTYSGFATLAGEKLTMKGCLTSAGILCQTRTFTRAN